jgi:hypothetical protein
MISSLSFNFPSDINGSMERKTRRMYRFFTLVIIFNMDCGLWIRYFHIIIGNCGVEDFNISRVVSDSPTLSNHELIATVMYKARTHPDRRYWVCPKSETRYDPLC